MASTRGFGLDGVSDLLFLKRGASLLHAVQPPFHSHVVAVFIGLLFLPTIEAVRGTAAIKGSLDNCNGHLFPLWFPLFSGHLL